VTLRLWAGIVVADIMNDIYSVLLTDARDKSREEKEVKLSPGTFQELLDGYVSKLETEGAASAGDVKWSFKHYVSDAFPALVSAPSL